MNNEKLTVYYDHYKESFALSKEAQKRRNTLFLSLCILEALSFLFVINPIEVLTLFTAFANSKLETSITLGINVFQTLLWIMIAYTLVRYCQDVLYVERQYSYLDKLERKISSELQENVFCREGEHYLENYPIVLNLIDLFYKMFSPILFVAINIVRIRMEWINSGNVSFALICDTIIFAVVIIIMWFFFFEIHSKIATLAKRYIPFINKISTIIHKILKAV